MFYEWYTNLQMVDTDYQKHISYFSHCRYVAHDNATKRATVRQTDQESDSATKRANLSYTLKFCRTVTMWAEVIFSVRYRRRPCACGIYI